MQADHGADPMAAVIGAHANFDAHERVVSRLILRPLAHDWSEPYKRLGLGGAGSHNAAQSIEEQRSKSTGPSKPSSSDDDGNNGLSVFGGLAIVGLVGFMVAKWFQGLPTNSQVVAGVVMALLFVASLIGAFFWWRSRSKPKLVDDYVNPTLAMSRINDLAYQIEINVTVLIKRGPRHGEQCTLANAFHHPGLQALRPPGGLTSRRRWRSPPPHGRRGLP